MCSIHSRSSPSRKRTLQPVRLKNSQGSSYRVCAGNCPAMASLTLLGSTRGGWDDGVVDTVGAGDSFMAGLLAAMAGDRALGTDAHDPSEGEVARWLLFAIACAAITCTRQGAQPPTRAEVGRVLGVG